MTQGIKDPKTGKTYTFKGFAPTRRVSGHCQSDQHPTCPIAPQHLIEQFDFEFTKSYSCLCKCHFQKEEK